LLCEIRFQVKEEKRNYPNKRQQQQHKQMEILVDAARTFEWLSKLREFQDMLHEEAGLWRTDQLKPSLTTKRIDKTLHSLYILITLMEESNYFAFVLACNELNITNSCIRGREAKNPGYPSVKERRERADRLFFSVCREVSEYCEQKLKERL
jgi:hypothetical protein